MAGNKEAIDRKLVVVGDGYCGKTCLLVTYCSDSFPDIYVPTVFETYTTFVQFNQHRVRLSLWDTAGEEDYDRLRPLSYSQANVVVMCFALDSQDSLGNVETKWEPEIRHFLPKVPIVLVGNKKDIRDDYRPPAVLPRNYKPPVTTSEGRAVASRIRAAAYIECSALRLTGVREVFDAAIKASLQQGLYTAHGADYEVTMLMDLRSQTGDKSVTASLNIRFTLEDRGGTGAVCYRCTNLQQKAILN